MKRFPLFLNLIIACAAVAFAQEGVKLTGTVVGTAQSVDYSTNTLSYTVNTAAMAHDGDLSTCFASYARSYTYTGLDLGDKYVITKVGWSPRNDSLGPNRLVLGMFEGANREDFLDAVPLYMITQACSIGTYGYGEVDCSRGFRYVRYVGPSDARCNVAEVEFYGYRSDGDDSHIGRITNLPTVIIHTVDAEEPYDKEHNITSLVTVLSDDDGGYILEADATTRLRGNASLQFDKKPYRIKFEKKQHILPDTPAKCKKWTLINNYGDKTLIRNCIAFEVSRIAGMEYTPYCRLVDVVLNGEYKGTYQLCDQVEVNPGRIEIDEMTPEDISGEALTGGYFIEVDAYADQEVSWFNSYSYIPVTIKSPEDDAITSEQRTYIEDYFNDMDHRVYNSKWAGSGSYREILDMPSFIRHFLIGEVCGNPDTYWSTYMTKRRGDDLLRVGPVWDFDLAMDNDSRIYPVNNRSNWIYKSASSAGSMKTFASKVLESDPASAEEIYSIWSQMRFSGLDADYLDEYIDSLVDEINASQSLNFKRWPILNRYVHLNPKTYSTYQAAVNDVKSFMRKRITWIDNKLGFDPSGARPVAVDSDEPVEYYNLQGMRVLEPQKGMLLIKRQGTTAVKIIY